MGHSYGSDPTEGLSGGAIQVKRRDDAPGYASPSASLDNVNIQNGIVDGTSTGIRTGEPGKLNAGTTNLTIANVDIGTASVVEHGNRTQTPLEATGTTGDDVMRANVLATGQFIFHGGDGKGDTLASIENVIGATTGEGTAIGGTGDNTITGGNQGDDTIDGGEGNDLLLGGAGADTYVIGPLNGADVIGHFDKFDVADLSALGLFADVTEVQAVSSDVRGGVLIDLGGGSSLTILGKFTATLDNGDFIF